MLESGKGCRAEGPRRQAATSTSSAASSRVSVGHANERVNAAVHAQMDRLGHVSTLYPTLPIVELAEKLVKLAPGKLEEGVLLRQRHRGRRDGRRPRADRTPGGRSSSRSATATPGRSLLAQSLTGHAKYRVMPTQVAAIKHAHAPYCYRCPFGLTYPSCERRSARRTSRS